MFCQHHFSVSFLLSATFITTACNIVCLPWTVLSVSPSLTNLYFAKTADLIIIIITSPPQSHLGRAHRSCTTCNKVPLVTMGHTKITPKQPIPLDRPHSPPRTASESSQPFCHNILSGQTDRPTHGIGDNAIPIALILYHIYCVWCANDDKRICIVPWGRDFRGTG